MAEKYEAERIVDHAISQALRAVAIDRTFEVLQMREANTIQGQMIEDLGHQLSEARASGDHGKTVVALFKDDQPVELGSLEPGLFYDGQNLFLLPVQPMGGDNLTAYSLTTGQAQYISRDLKVHRASLF